MQLRIGQACEFKPAAGLGGWRPGTVTGFVGKLIEVEAGGSLYPVPSSRVRPSKAETRPDRGAQQAAARAQRLVMAPPPMPGMTDLMVPPESLEEVIPRDVEPVAMRAVYPGTGAARVPVFAPQPKAPKPTRSRGYLKFAVMQRCAITGEMAEVAHHYENAGRSRKCSDFMVVPLTNEAHRGWHDASDGWMSHAGESARARGESYDLLATKLAMAEAGWRALVAFLERKEGGEDE